MSIPQAVLDAEKKAEEQVMAPVEPEAPQAVVENSEPAAPEPIDVPVEVPEVSAIQEPEAPTESQAYKVLQGKYNAEVPRLSQEKRELERVKAEQEAEIQKLREQLSAKPSTESVDLTKYVEPEKLEEYGEDYIQLVARVAGKVADERVSRVEADLTRNREMGFLDSIKTRVPEFDKLNESPDFINWLNTPDTYGRKMDDVLQTAQRTGNAELAASIFNTYKERKAGVKVEKPDLERQIAPNKQVAAQPSDDGKRRFTKADIVKIENDIIRGQYLPSDAKKIRDEIDQAWMSGRVT